MNDIQEFQERLRDLLILEERGYAVQAKRCMWDLVNMEPLRPVRVPDHARKLGCPKS